MSSSEGEEEVKEPVPEHRVRFTDMPQKLVDQAVRSKHSALAPRANLAPASFSCVVCDAATKKEKLDKDIATEIQKMIQKDAELDGTALRIRLA